MNRDVYKCIQILYTVKQKSERSLVGIREETRSKGEERCLKYVEATGKQDEKDWEEYIKKGWWGSGGLDATA